MPTSSSPSKAPTWVCVLPTSTATIIGRLSQPAHATVLQAQVRLRRVANRDRPHESAPVHDPRIPSQYRRSAHARAEGHRLLPHRPRRGDLEADPEGGRLSRRHGPGPAHRRRQGAGQSGDRARARSPRAGSAAVPIGSRGPGEGGGGRALGGRGSADGRPAARLEPPEQEPQADRELSEGSEARAARIPRRQDGAADRRALGALQRGRPTPARSPTLPSCRRCSTGSTPNRRRHHGRRSAERRRPPDRDERRAADDP